MDQWKGCMWILTTNGAQTLPARPKNELWKLDLDRRQWTRMSLELPHSILEPLVYCIPMGKCFLLGDCPEFPTSWLPLFMEGAHVPNHCTTPAHLYTMWLDVPTLGRLTMETLRKHFPGLDLRDPETTKKLGLPPLKIIKL